MIPVELHDGTVLEFEDGTPDIVIDRVVKSHVRKAKIAKIQEKPIDPTEGMSGTDKFLAGAGKAFYDVGRGVGQLVGVVDRKDIDEANARDKALMDTGAGTAGNIVGNIAAYAPLAVVPGANTVGGGAAIGALSGALQPVGENDSRAGNAVIGGAFGGALPAIGRVASTAKAAVVDPFTESGLNRIAGGVLRRGASDADAAYANLARNTGKTPNFAPTVGQASADSGLASMERAARAIDPQGFGSIAEQQRGALASAVRGIGADDATIAALKESRDSAADALYGSAMHSDEMRMALERGKQQQLNSVFSLNTPSKVATEVPSGIKSLMDRPAFRAAMDDGKALAENLGETFDPSSLQSLHYAKIALDEALNGKAGAGSALANYGKSALTGIKKKLLDEMEAIAPSYKNARTVFQDMSKPINSAEVGNAVSEKFIPAMYRDMDNPLSLNYDSLARAVRDNGDTLAQNVTGFKGAKLADTLGAEKMQVLNNVLSDAELIKMGELLGKGGGSDTIQKAAMSHIMSASGIPNWLQSVGSVPGGWIKRAGDLLYGNADDAVRLKLADALKNPQQAATLMKAAGVAPSKIAKALKALGQAAQAPMFALPAVMNAE